MPIIFRDEDQPPDLQALGSKDPAQKITGDPWMDQRLAQQQQMSQEQMNPQHVLKEQQMSQQKQEQHQQMSQQQRLHQQGLSQQPKLSQQGVTHQSQLQHVGLTKPALQHTGADTAMSQHVRGLGTGLTDAADSRWSQKVCLWGLDVCQLGTLHFLIRSFPLAHCSSKLLSISYVMLAFLITWQMPLDCMLHRIC